MSKYDPISKWLGSQSANRISCTFSQIEGILGLKLPATARVNVRWWANEAVGNTRHVQCLSWLRAGYQTTSLNLAKQSVVFVRV